MGFGVLFRCDLSSSPSITSRSERACSKRVGFLMSMARNESPSERCERLALWTMRRACGGHLQIGEPGSTIVRLVAVGFIEGQMTLYRGPLETVEAFQYQAALETMDFKYPFRDWLRDVVTVRENAILQLDTDFGLVWVKPGQWVVKHSRGNLDILDPEEFHRRYRAVSD